MDHVEIDYLIQFYSLSETNALKSIGLLGDPHDQTINYNQSLHDSMSLSELAVTVFNELKLRECA